MALMNQKNMMLSPAATDLGVGTNLKVQVDDQVNENKKRMKAALNAGQQFGPAVMDLLGTGAGA
jgi:hypothetical protein